MKLFKYLFLVLLSAGVFVSCSDDDDQQSVEGTWEIGTKVATVFVLDEEGEFTYDSNGDVIREQVDLTNEDLCPTTYVFEGNSVTKTSFGASVEPDGCTDENRVVLEGEYILIGDVLSMTFKKRITATEEVELLTQEEIDAIEEFNDKQDDPENELEVPELNPSESILVSSFGGSTISYEGNEEDYEYPGQTIEEPVIQDVFPVITWDKK